MMKIPIHQSGYILPTLIITTLFISLSITYVMSLSLTTYNMANRDIYRANAQMTADAALDEAMTILNTLGTAEFDDTFSDEVTFLTDQNLTTTYQTALLDGVSDDRKTLSVIARTKINGDTKITRRYEVDLQAVTSGTGPAAVVSGVGGLFLNNNSRITGGDVIVNGRVTINNNAQIGLSTNPVNLRVANVACPQPVDSSYPQVCTSGQPITANGPIYGEVHAQGQTNGSNMFNPGLTSSVFPPVAVPGYNRFVHKESVTTSLQANDSNIACGNNQTKNWPANLKIDGSVSTGNGCVVNINGDVWITGSLNIGNNSNFIISNDLGTTRPIIMIDGSTGLTFGNNGRVTPNSFGTGAEFITVWWNTNTSTNGGFNCGGIADPFECTNVTGLALSTSQSTTTIDFNNNASASGSVLRTLWSRAFIANNAALGAIAGQTVQLGNNAVINFTASIPGSDNMIVTWAKRGYMRVYQ